MAPKLKIDLVVDDKGKVALRQFGAEAERMGHKGAKSFGTMDTATGRLNKTFASTHKLLLGIGSTLMGMGLGYGIKKLLDQFKEFETALVDMGKVTDRSLAEITYYKIYRKGNHFADVHRFDEVVYQED